MEGNNIYRRSKQSHSFDDEISNSIDRRNSVVPSRGLPFLINQRVWARGILLIVAFIIVYFSSAKEKETIFASQKDVFKTQKISFPCSETYKSELEKFKGCTPKFCGRLVSDTLISNAEVDTLINIAKTGIALGGSEGGASILDLHSGALSHGQNFVNFYKLPESTNILKSEDYITYIVVKNKIQEAIAENFGIQSKYLHLTHPTFFSRLTNLPPRTMHDEYWHKHVDKETYESFHYTSLLYLNDFKKEFSGGRFVFIDADNRTSVIEPKKGRVSMFTSGAENPHYVERVLNGVRYAITVSFTCDPAKAIPDLRTFS